jgi:predicted DNA-binding protein with PD1-like motif
MPCRQIDGGWILRLETGELIQESLGRFCEKNAIESGSYRAIGAVRWARLGYYDQEKDEYVEERVDGGFEVVSLNGNVSRKSDGTLFPHTHCILSNREMRTLGGHLFEAEVGPTFECYIYPAGDSIRRTAQPDSPVELLDL